MIDLRSHLQWGIGWHPVVGTAESGWRQDNQVYPVRVGCEASDAAEPCLFKIRTIRG